jgi:RimJ/RimL family protein N-acetyltransferase
MRFVGEPASLEAIEREVLPAFLAYHARADGYGFWAAVEPASGEFVGWFHLRPRAGQDPPDEPELGYRLHRRFWGRGLGTEAARALVARAFLELGARRVHASTAADNVGSRRVLERSGLRLVREYWSEEYGAVDVEYEARREDWDGGGPGA